MFKHYEIFQNVEECFYHNSHFILHKPIQINFFIANPSNFVCIVTLFQDMGAMNNCILLDSIQKNSQWLK